MIVSQLIEELQKLPPYYPVIVKHPQFPAESCLATIDEIDLRRLDSRTGVVVEIMAESRIW